MEILSPGKAEVTCRVTGLPPILGEAAWFAVARRRFLFLPGQDASLGDGAVELLWIGRGTVVNKNVRLGGQGHIGQGCPTAQQV